MHNKLQAAGLDAAHLANVGEVVEIHDLQQSQCDNVTLSQEDWHTTININHFVLMQCDIPDQGGSEYNINYNWTFLRQSRTKIIWSMIKYDEA